MKKNDFEKYLRKNRCFLLREGNRHEIWVNKNNGKQTSIPRHKELANITCKIICKQLEIPLPSKF